MNGVADECDVVVGTSCDWNTNGRPDECDDQVCSNGLWDGFENPPFSLGSSVDGIDYVADGILWQNPEDTALIQLFGCESGGFGDKAIQLTVLPSPTDPADGFAESEWFQSDGGALAPTQQLYSLSFRAKLETARWKGYASASLRTEGAT